MLIDWSILVTKYNQVRVLAEKVGLKVKKGSVSSFMINLNY